MLSKRQIIQGLKSPIKSGLRRWISWSNSGGILARRYLKDYKVLFPAAGFLNFYFISEIQPDHDLNYVIQKCIHKDDLIIDVGANIGLTVLLFAHQLQNGKGQIVALEPSAQPRQFLQANCAINELSCVTVIPLGAGETEQSAVLFSHKSDGNRSSSLLEEYVVEGAASTEHIELTTLDAMVKNFGIPSFIKIDVEGFEQSVLNGLTIDEVWKNTIFFIEVRESTFDVILKILEDKGYAVYFVQSNQLMDISKLDKKACFYDHLALIDLLGVPSNKRNLFAV